MSKQWILWAMACAVAAVAAGCGGDDACDEGMVDDGDGGCVAAGEGGGDAGAGAEGGEDGGPGPGEGAEGAEGSEGTEGGEGAECDPGMACTNEGELLWECGCSKCTKVGECLQWVTLDTEAECEAQGEGGEGGLCVATGKCAGGNSKCPGTYDVCMAVTGECKPMPCASDADCADVGKCDAADGTGTGSFKCDLEAGNCKRG